jgi:hypothetical protein
VQTSIVVDKRRERGSELRFGPRFGDGGVGCGEGSDFVERSPMIAKERTASSDGLDIPIVIALYQVIFGVWKYSYLDLVSQGNAASRSWRIYSFIFLFLLRRDSTLMYSIHGQFYIQLSSLILLSTRLKTTWLP